MIVGSILRMRRDLRGLLRSRRITGPARTVAWPDDDAWVSSARPCDEFHLDSGYAVTSHVPGWMLPVDAPDDLTILLPSLPQVGGHVLTAETVGREDELVSHFAQLPRLPDPARRRETAAFCSLDVNILISLPRETAIVADMFSGSQKSARALLDILADLNGPAEVVYDDLDQGWAVRIQVERNAVMVLEWNWEAADGLRRVRALRLPRDTIAAQALAARHRLDHLHACLLAALGTDLWDYPARG